MKSMFSDISFRKFESGVFKYLSEVPVTNCRAQRNVWTSFSLIVNLSNLTELSIISAIFQ